MLLVKIIFKIVELLLENGANVNITNRNESSPLIISSLKGHKEIVKLLLEYKADINQKNCAGVTALDSAHSRGLNEIEEILKNWDFKSE